MYFVGKRLPHVGKLLSLQFHTVQNFSPSLGQELKMSLACFTAPKNRSQEKLVNLLNKITVRGALIDQVTGILF